MKNAKKLTSVILAIVLLFSVLSCAPFSTLAATSGDYEYTVLDDGTVKITEYTGNATSLSIPSKLSGYTVTSIGEEAFWGCSSLTSVKIPDGVTTIEDFAFENCPSLTTISIPKSITSIGDNVLQHCSSLTKINVDSGNKNYSSKDGVLFNKDMTELIQYPFGNEESSYTIPNSVTSIGNWAFRYCTNLTDVTIPNSVKSIGILAFNSSGLKSISIPNSVTYLSGSEFSGCTDLKSVTLSDGLTSIGGSSFFACTSLTSITIPNGVTSIGAGAFGKCFSLTSVTIPSSVTKIELEAFQDCNAIKDVYYTGSKDKWNKIAIDLYNDALQNATIHYDYIPQVATPKLSSVANTATGIKITWGKVDGAEKYRVFYKTGSGNWKKLADTTSTSYTWTKAKSGTKYTFTVRCVSSDGKSFTSAYDTKGKSITYIAAPKLSSVSNTTTGVKISWGKVAGAAKYRIFYKTGNGKWKKLTDTTSTSYTWKKAKSGTKYIFTVRCVTKDGKSYTSAYDTKGKGITFVSAPKISKLSKTSSGVQIKWGKVDGAAKYRVFYKTANGKWKKLTDTTKTSYTWKGGKKGTNYSFTVRCISKDGKTYTSAYDTKGKSIKR